MKTFREIALHEQKRTFEFHPAPIDVELTSARKTMVVQEIGVLDKLTPVYRSKGKLYTYSKMQMRLFPLKKSVIDNALGDVDKISEASDEKIYYVKDELWIANAQGSGQTIQYRNINQAKSNKSGDRTYDSSVDKIVKWAKTNKPLKTNKDKNVLLFEIPVYPLMNSWEGKYEIWGGDVKPLKHYYMIVSIDGIAVVQLFDKKNEALAWIRSA